MTPLAHAALAASQKMAKIAVKQKSCKEIDVSFYSMINGGGGFFFAVDLPPSVLSSVRTCTSRKRKHKLQG